MFKKKSTPAVLGHINRLRRMVRWGYETSLSVGLTRQPGSKALPPIFVIGSGRSGNTLIRRVLLASGQVYIPPETYVMGDILETWPRSAGLEWQKRVWLFCAHFEKHDHFRTFGIQNLNEFAAMAGSWPKKDRNIRKLYDGFYHFLAEHAGSPAERWGDKSPWNVYHLPSIGWHYPDAHFLWLVRDGRDAALSYAKAGLYPDLKTAAIRWTEANDLCADFAATKMSVLQVRYEDLVSNPEPQFTNIFQWAGLEFNVEMLTRLPQRMGDVEALEHHANVAQPISAKSIGQWRKELTEADLESLPKAFHDQLHRLGYIE